MPGYDDNPIIIPTKGRPSGLNTITGNSQKSAPIYYDLTGRRVERPTRGIYIRNGKKISIK